MQPRARPWKRQSSENSKHPSASLLSPYRRGLVSDLSRKSHRKLGATPALSLELPRSSLQGLLRSKLPDDSLDTGPVLMVFVIVTIVEIKLTIMMLVTIASFFCYRKHNNNTNRGCNKTALLRMRRLLIARSFKLCPRPPSRQKASLGSLRLSSLLL